MRNETQAAIDKMFSELKSTPQMAENTSEVSVSDDTMKIDETNVIVNIEDDPFTKLYPTDNVLNQMKILEEEKRSLEEERLKIEEEKNRLIEED
jgi:hypothetical protein